MPARVLCAPQGFKGTLSARQVAAALAAGAERVAGIVADACPLADGGDDSVDVLAATGEELITDEVAGPLPGRRVRATRLARDRGKTAVVELAAASGLRLLSPAERDPLAASTFGTGEQIAAALADGAQQVLLMVGGSATVDGGTGLLSALGYRFLDAIGRELPPGGGSLASLARIDVTQRHGRLDSAAIVVGVDVDNPLLGPTGAAAVYGPQKGASPAAVEQLERGLERLAGVIRAQFRREVADLPGGGAAGGVAAGLAGILGAELVSGFQLVAQAVQLEARVAASDLVLTGEGRLDVQSSHGKTSWAVAAIARRLSRPCYAIVGSCDLSIDQMGGVFDGVVTAGQPPAMATAGDVASAAERVVRSWLAGNSAGSS